jgi:hypothetical protein
MALTYVDPALLESMGIYGADQQAYADANGMTLASPTAQASTGVNTPTGPQSGAAVIAAVLRSAGLELTPEVAQYADQLRTLYGSDITGLQNQLAADLYTKGNPLGDLVAKTYPEIAARTAAGLTNINVAEAQAYRNQVTQTMKAYGLPSGFYDSPDDWVNFHTADLSADEINHRITQGYAAAMNADQGVRDQLSRLYGVDQGALAAYYLDPKRAEPLLTNQFAASQAAAGANLGGYQLTAGEAERAGGMGLGEGQAAQAFGNLTNQRELFNPLAGEQGQSIDRTQQVNAALGDTAAQEAIDRVARARRAVFGAGGGYAGGQTGVTGLGTAAA